MRTMPPRLLLWGTRVPGPLPPPRGRPAAQRIPAEDASQDGRDVGIVPGSSRKQTRERERERRERERERQRERQRERERERERERQRERERERERERDTHTHTHTHTDAQREEVEGGGYEGGGWVQRAADLAGDEEDVPEPKNPEQRSPRRADVVNRDAQGSDVVLCNDPKEPLGASPALLLLLLFGPAAASCGSIGGACRPVPLLQQRDSSCGSPAFRAAGDRVWKGLSGQQSTALKDEKP